MEQLVSRKTIAAMFDLSKGGAYNLTKEPGFPTPILIGSSVRWYLSEVTEWQNRRQRQPKAPKAFIPKQRMANPPKLTWVDG